MDSSAILASNWLGIIATTGHLGIVILILRRGRKNPLWLPLLLLCSSMTVWSFAAAIHQLFGGLGWRWLEGTVSPILIPLALHVVLSFVGRRRRHIVFLTANYIYFVALSVVGAVWLFGRDMPEHSPESQAWAMAFLLGAIVPLLYVIYRLTRHARAAQDPDEATRARLILAGLVVGLAFGATELVNNIIAPIPDLGHVGTLAVTGTLTVVVLRFRLFDYEVAVGGWLAGTFIALAVVSGYILFSGTSPFAFALFVAAALAFVGVVGFREVLLTRLRRRERMEQYATLGRFSAQMAHDLKNPLAAMKGALQFLEAELQAREDVEHDEVVSLMDEQVRRIEAIVDRYHRMSAVEPRREAFDLRSVCERQVRAAKAAHPGVEFETRFPDGFPRCDGDEELLTLVIENIVSNAAEAGSERVEVSGESGWSGITLHVRDDGDGMGARDLERAFDDFFTTKPTGTGLGLAFARRVVRAHDGRIELLSTEEIGTEVTIHLPSA